MKQITISRNQLELTRAELRRPMMVIGRSPTCDVVLRAPGIEPIHFLVEWIGAGVFDPNHGSWSIVDISAHADQGAESGAGVVLSKAPVVLSDLTFGVTEDRLESSEVIGGQILESLSVRAAGKSGVLEFVQVRSDSGAIEEVLHIPMAPRGILQKRVVPIHKGLKTFKLEWPREAASPGKVILGLLLEEMRDAEILLNGKKLDPKKKIDLKASDFLRVKWNGRDFFVRFVDEINAPPIPRQFWGDPLLRKLTLSVVSMALVFLLLVWVLPKSKLPEKEIPRIARIEIPALPAQNVTETPTDEVQSEEKTQAPPIEEKQKQTPTKAAAPRFKSENQALKTKSGLNSPAQVSDVNQVGLLGAFQKNAKKGKGVTANQVMNQGVVSKTASGKGVSSIALRNPPPGALGSGSSGSASGVNEQDLAAASTTLSGVSDYDPGSVGPIARKGGKSGYQIGTSSIGTDRGQGGGATLGSLDGNDFSVEGGGLDREAVRRIISSYRGQIRTCYERALLSSPNLEGRVVYEWRIQPEGKVGGVEMVRSTLTSEHLKLCVLEVMQGMVFPKATNGKTTRVIYPFVFQGKR